MFTQNKNLKILQVLLLIVIIGCGVSLTNYASKTMPQPVKQASVQSSASYSSKASSIKSSTATSVLGVDPKAVSTIKDVTAELLAPQTLANATTSARAYSQANMILKVREDIESKQNKVAPIIVAKAPVELPVVPASKALAPAVASTQASPAPDPVSLASKAEWDKIYANFTKPTGFVPTIEGVSVKANLTSKKLEVFENGALTKTFDFTSGCNMTYASCVGDQSKDKEWLQTPSLFCVNNFKGIDFKFQVPEGRKARTSKYVISLRCQTLDGGWEGTEIMFHTNDWNGTKTGGCIMPVAGQGYSFVEYLFNKNFVISFVN